MLIAVADGASEAVYSRLWAYALVKAADPVWPTLNDDELNERLTQVRKSFSPLPPDAQIPWYVRNKFLTQGSQATLLVTSITRSKEEGEFIVRSVAVGDCCLLLFSANGGVNSFPVRSVADFNLNPVLVMNRNQVPLEFARSELRVRHGDFLLVCTDATGKWALQCLESNQAALLFDVLLGLLSHITDESDQSVEEPDRVETPMFSEARLAPISNNSSTGRLRQMINRLFGKENPSSKMNASVPGNNQPSINQQYETPKETLYSPLDYEQFINQHRAPASQPRMRNDDATLVLCLPVRSMDRDTQAEALAIISKHRASAEQRPLLALNSSQ